MAVVKITKRAIDAVHPTDKDVSIWDAELKGYGVRSSPRSAKNPNGVKGYLVQYRVGGGRRGTTRRYTFGNVDSMTAEEARARARGRGARARSVGSSSCGTGRGDGCRAGRAVR
jgi:hypothetical protein